MRKLYTVYATNLYAVAATLIHDRIPFTFRPHKAYRNTKNKSPYKLSTIDFEIDERFCSVAQILYEMNEKYHSTFDFEIISEVEV